MINLIIYFSVLLICAISLFATYLTASKPNKNILLAVTLPYEFLTDSKVLEIVKKYKHANRVTFIISLVAAIPLFGIKYTSITILYLFLWFVVLMRVYSSFFKRYNNQLLLLKRQNHIVNIDADDDEYWKNGYYYNPTDNQAMVEKRFGYGYTFNMAKTKGKVITYGSIALGIIVVLGIFLMFLRFDFTTFEMLYSGGTIEIKAPMYGHRFSFQDIEEVTIIKTLPKGARTNGVATGTYSLGNFNLNGYGKSKMYIYKDYPPYIVIKLKDSFVFLNTNSKEKTLQYYEMLLNKINKN